MDGAPALKPATQVHAGQALVLLAPPRRFVSRGGDKLAHALDHFAIEVAGRRCLDAGVSTGGFTDCLLQAGADTVVAYDVGYGQVHDRLRADPRVEVNERTNVRTLTPDDLRAPRPDLLVADLSFISLTLVVPTLLSLIEPTRRAAAVVLVKPQFEAERAEVGKGGVVRDPEVWSRCLHRVSTAVEACGWTVVDVTPSPLLGPAGNVEFLLHLEPGSADREVVTGRIAAAVAAARGQVTDG